MALILHAHKRKTSQAAAFFGDSILLSLAHPPTPPESF